MEIEMKIRGLMVDPSTHMPIVLLKDPGSDTLLPIWVGLYEANAIALEIEKNQPLRPLTHDLLRELVRSLNAKVLRVVVTELRDDTFYAVIWMEQNGEIVALDARPSDALALAMRTDCPIYVDESVLLAAKVLPNPAEQASSQDVRKWLENLNDEDMGRYKM
ncbi:bifunctional nuclease family protein [Silvibacterium sp.]|uniref:bifunctional nuclease family protein n=1 Tax=Silvibacterium sp. TaxID=1964179 RepID=UPI0039E21C97